jgi:hypothetical protein
MKRQFPAGIFGRRARYGEDLGFAFSAQFIGKFGLRLDEDTRPSGLFQKPGLRTFTRFIGADLDKISFYVAEERADEPILTV